MVPITWFTREHLKNTILRFARIAQFASLQRLLPFHIPSIFSLIISSVTLYFVSLISILVPYTKWEKYYHYNVSNNVRALWNANLRFVGWSQRLQALCSVTQQVVLLYSMWKINYNCVGARTVPLTRKVTFPTVLLDYGCHDWLITLKKLRIPGDTYFNHFYFSVKVSCWLKRSIRKLSKLLPGHFLLRKAPAKTYMFGYLTKDFPLDEIIISITDKKIKV